MRERRPNRPKAKIADPSGNVVEIKTYADVAVSARDLAALVSRSNRARQLSTARPGAHPVRTLTVLGCDGSWPGPGGAGSGYLVAGRRDLDPARCGPGHLRPTPAARRPGCRRRGGAQPTPIPTTGRISSRSPPGPGTGRAGSGSAGRAAALSRCSPRRGCGSGRTTPGRLGRLAGAGAVHGAHDRVVSRPAFAATDHGTPTLAVRLAHEGATLAYRPTRARAGRSRSWARASGTFLCEATYTQELEGSLLHLSGREAGAMARAAGVRRLIVTHRWPTVSADDVRREAELAFGRPVEQASMGAVFDW